MVASLLHRLLSNSWAQVIFSHHPLNSNNNAGLALALDLSEIFDWTSSSNATILLNSPIGQLEFMNVLNNVMQIKQVNKSNTQSIHNNIKMLYPVMNFIGSKGGISSQGRKKLNSSCTRTCLERNSDEACSDHTGADAHSEQRPHEQIFIVQTDVYSHNNTKATDKTVSAPELLGSGEVLRKLTHSTYQPGRKNSCVRASGGHDHN